MRYFVKFQFNFHRINGHIIEIINFININLADALENSTLY